MDSASHRTHLTLPVSQRDHVQGTNTSPITLVEYGSYACPYCSEAQLIVQHIQQQLGAQFRIVFRHFPQANRYPEAQHAAEAAEAAAAQGKFWQMHHHLFAHQSALSNGYLVEYALELGLNINQFLHQMRSDVHLNRVHEDIRSGIQSGVSHTPTFFINSIRHDDAWDSDTLIAAMTRGMP